MAYKTFDIANAESSYEMDLTGLVVHVVKVKTARWLLVDSIGTVMVSKRAEESILEAAARIEERRMRGNLHGFRFGSKIDAATVEGYAAAVWGEEFNYSNIEFDGHYWWADITVAATGETSEHLRMDYHINYERRPEAA